MTSGFSNEELLRYSRHFILPEVGLGGQQKLKNARVLLVGLGGLGSPAALYLAASGVGEIGVVDFDRVDLSNLHRQVIHSSAAVGKSKLDSAESAIYAVNPNVKVTRHESRLTSANALDILAPYDLVVDGTDNFPTRYLVNDACVLLKKPNMYGSIFRFEGQATVFCTPKGPCYRCLFPEPPPPGAVPSCAEAGVLGVLPGIIGLVQATEAVKHILGVGESLVGRFLMYDALEMRFTELRIHGDPQCPACGDSPTLEALIDYEQFCGVASSGEPVKIAEIDCGQLEELRSKSEDFVLLDVREPDERAVSRIPDSHFIPLGQLPSRAGELDSDKKTVIYCRSGIRSARACSFLQEAGFKDVINLKGGIEAWLRGA